MIELNKIGADLTFVGSTITNLVVETHRQSIKDSIKTEFAMSVRHRMLFTDENFKNGQLRLQIDTVIKSNDGIPDDKFTLVLEGTFKASKEMEDEKFIAMLNINGGATLYSIARSKLEIISSASYIEGKILLPLINMIQYFKQAKAEKENQAKPE